jgi:large conductance mechanosensitive channel
VSFTSLFIALDGKTYPSLELAKAAGAPTINYGNFLQTVIDFVIIAFAVFMLIKAMNYRKKEVAPAAPPSSAPCRPAGVNGLPRDAGKLVLPTGHPPWGASTRLHPLVNRLPPDRV